MVFHIICSTLSDNVRCCPGCSGFCCLLRARVHYWFGVDTVQCQCHGQGMMLIGIDPRILECIHLVRHVVCLCTCTLSNEACHRGSLEVWKLRSLRAQCRLIGHHVRCVQTRVDKVIYFRCGCRGKSWRPLCCTED